MASLLCTRQRFCHQLAFAVSSLPWVTHGKDFAMCYGGPRQKKNNGDGHSTATVPLPCAQTAWHMVICCPDGVAHDKASFFVMCCWQGTWQRAILCRVLLTRHPARQRAILYHVLWLKHTTKRDSLFAVCHGHSTRQIDHFSYFIFIRSRIWYPNHHMQFINIKINITSISYIIISITGSLYSQSNLQMQINSFIHNH